MRLLSIVLNPNRLKIINWIKTSSTSVIRISLNTYIQCNAMYYVVRDSH